MANAIINQLSREVGHAYVEGKTVVHILGKVFKMEHSYKNHWYLTDESGKDIGFRFDVVGKTIKYYLA